MWMTLASGASSRAARSASDAPGKRVDAFSVPVAEKEEGEQGTVFVEYGHSGSLALVADQPFFAGKRIKGLAQRSLADSVFFSECDFTGQEASRPPFSGNDAVENGLFHLFVQWSECEFR